MSTADRSIPEGPFAVFAEPQFRWLFAGNAAFFFAMNGQMLTRSILAWHLAGEATALAYINLVVAVPMLIASLVGGAIADRLERRRIVMLGQGLLIACELVVFTLLLLDKLQFWHLMVVGFFAGCAFPFIMPARMAITASVVGVGRMQSAMAFSGGLMNLSRVAGPAVMGLIIASYSLIAASALAVVLYLTAVCCMLGVRPNRPTPSSGPKKALLADIGQGLAYVRHHRPILMCILFGLLPMFVAMPFQNLMVMLAEQSWQQGESAVGTLIAIGGVGGVLGSMWIVHRGETPHRIVFMFGTSLAFALFLGVFAQTPNYHLALLPLLIANVCASAAQTLNSSVVQILVEDEMRGRISSLMMLSFGLMPIGVFPMAIAADHFGAANAVTGSCVLLFVLTVWFYWVSRSLRNLDQTVNRKLGVAASAAANG